MPLVRGMLVFALCCSVAAQEPVFHSQTNVVLVPALVKDASGNAVYGLQAKDFVLEDDSSEQVVRIDEAADAEMVSVVVAVQTGRRADREFPRIRGLSTMLEPILAQGQTEMAVVSFDDHVELLQDFTSDPSLVAFDLKRLSPGDNGAAIIDAVDYSLRLLDERPKDHKRVLLLISEERDHGSQGTLDNVVTLMGSSNTVIYTLAFSPALSDVLDTGRGSNQDEWSQNPDLLAVLALVRQAMRQNTAKAIASMTGGEYELFTSSKRFELDMTKFTNHLHSRYLLSFEPKDPHPGLHHLQVRLRGQGGATVLARTSYWANENP